MTMQTMLATMAAEQHRTALSKLPRQPAVIQPAVETPWFGVIEWYSPAYERDHQLSGLGALVGPRHVLTCAQRVDTKMDERFISEGNLPMADKNFRVRIGGSLGQDYKVQHIVVHPKFTPVFATKRRRRIVDLAVLVLAEEVQASVISIGKPKSLRPSTAVSAFGTGPFADGPYGAAQVDTAVLPKTIGATAGPSKSEIVVANLAGADAMGPGFLGAPVTTQPQNADDQQLVALVSRAVLGLPTEDDLGAPCIAVDVTRHARWIAATVAAR